MGAVGGILALDKHLPGAIRFSPTGPLLSDLIGLKTPGIHRCISETEN
jgi:hypothetical protein